MRVLTLRMGIRDTLPERIYAAIAITMVAAFGVTLGLWALDSRSIDGISVWAKPLKFELALAIHAGTLALVVGRLGPRLRSGPVMQAVALAFLVACTVEMGWIIAQAAQGQQSHFNDSTALHRAMFSVMAFCAVIITGAAGAVAVAVWRDGSFGAPAPVRAGVVLGLLGGTILTLITAFAIGANCSPYFGGVPELSARMALTGWSLSSGDLRVAHFLATHMMQAVPFAALLAAYVQPDRAKLPLVIGVAVLWALWVLIEFRGALTGAEALFLDVVLL
jgi:hypothetical protein